MVWAWPTPKSWHGAMNLDIKDPALRAALNRISQRIAQAGGRALVVGGSVRDAMLGVSAKDLDLEVFGLAPEALRNLIAEDYPLDLVGQSFGVLKIRHLPIDLAIPRRESKRGLGHRGFAVHGDPHMTLAEAALRRDFTINALAWDPLTHELLDPTGGVADLLAGRLRHVSPKFAEDPLRVLRAMQLAARFNLQVDPATVDLCRELDHEGLAHERIFDEWKKLLLRGQQISRGLDFLRACGWVRFFPELQALIGCPQDPEWHPEGDVWVHTLHVMDAFASERLGDDWEDLVVGLACLCHDLGKPMTTALEDGRIRSRGHEEAGEAPTRALLARMTHQQRLVDEVVPLVTEHLKPTLLYKANAGPSALRRLARRVGRIDRLVRVSRADHRGRPPLPDDGFPAGSWLLTAAQTLALADQAPRPLVMGRHLLELGLRPGPQFKKLLDAVFEAQLDGRFDDLAGGIGWTRKLLASGSRENLTSSSVEAAE